MPESTADGLRTLLIGIDGASTGVLRERGRDIAPNVTAMLDDGAAGELESQVPPWTPSAWPSVYTGVNPGKHGVFGFLDFEGYDWDVVDYDDVKEYALWEVLDDHGFSSVVVNAPVTHPPSSFDGALVPGYVAPESPECHPRGLLEEIENEIGEYRVYDDETDPDDPQAERIASYEQLVESRGEAFRYLADRFDPDFGFLQFQQTDTVFHESPEDEAIVDAVYSAVDREIGATLDACDPDVVLLCSDHGIGPYDGHEFRANSFLRDRGHVETTAGDGGMPSWSSIARNELQTADGDAGGGTRDGADAGDAEAAGSQSSPSLLERSVAGAARVGITSQRIDRVATRLGIRDLVLEIAPADAVRAAAEHVDFEDSRAYVRDRIELGVRINLEGREPEGVVSEGEYEVLRSELIDALSAIRTPDGEPVFESVLRREDVFEGPHVEDAPDVIVVPNEYDQFLSASLRDEQFGPPQEPWNHKRHGVIAAVGDVDTEAELASATTHGPPGKRGPQSDQRRAGGTESGGSNDCAHLFDVAPTVLATFGVPTPERMDGEALPLIEPAGRESYPAYEPERFAGSGAGAGDGPEPATADEAVEERLAQMGYLER